VLKMSGHDIIDLEDHLMDDVEGEVPTPPDLEKDAPASFKSIWDDPHLSKMQCEGVNKLGQSVEKKGFHCHWCKITHKGGWNATKAVAHLAKKSGHDIKPCMGRIRADFLVLYRQMYSNSVQKKCRGVDLKANSKTDADRHDASVLYRSMERKAGNSAGIKQSINKFFAPSTARLGVAKPSSSTIQLKLDGSIPNPIAEKAATIAFASAIIRLGLPFSLGEEPLFRRACLAMRGVSKNFRFPSAQQIRTVHLNDQYDAQQDETLSLLSTNADLFGITIFGDGATVRKMPLINILANGAYCPAGLLEIRDASEHMAAGGIKDASYIASLIKPHILKLGKDNVDLCIMDGAKNVQNATNLLQIWFPRMSGAHGAEHLTALCLSDVAKTPQVTYCLFAWFPEIIFF
jgi:Protein of unknown function (DUF 659)